MTRREEAVGLQHEAAGILVFDHVDDAALLDRFLVFVGGLLQHSSAVSSTK